MKNSLKTPDPFNKNKNPKKKIIIISSIIGVVVIGLIVSTTLVEPPLFKGFLSPTISTTSTTKDVSTTTSTTESIADTSIKESSIVDIKEEPILMDAETKSEEEPKPLEIAPLKQEMTVLTPPKISFAYLERLDSHHPSIYGDVNYDADEVVLIFRLRNAGTMSAYLKSFNTTDNFNDYGCHGTYGYCNHLASNGGRLVRLNYDSNGNFINWTTVGQDSNMVAGEANYTEQELTNKSGLEIKGNSDAYFAIVNDTRDYGNFGYYNLIQAQAIILTNTLKIVDVNDNELSSISIDTDSITPGSMNYPPDY